MTIPRLTHVQLERVVASQCGLRLVAVAYAVLTGGGDGREVDEWDYGYWHEPTMGVQLKSGPGALPRRRDGAKMCRAGAVRV